MNISDIPDLSGDDILYWVTYPLIDDISWNEAIKMEAKKRGLDQILYENCTDEDNESNR